MFGGGSGTIEDPYLVEDAKDLDAVRYDLAAHYSQTKRINMKGWGTWEPIGYGDYSDAGFKGSYIGNGRSILNLSFSNATTETGQIGLFGHIIKARVEGVRTLDVTALLTDSQSVTIFGCVVGEARSSIISNCFSSGNATSTSPDVSVHMFGGVVGTSYGSKLLQCESAIKSSVAASISGGILGNMFNDLDGYESASSITDSKFTGTISGSAWYGGVVGYVQGYYYDQRSYLIKNCLSAGKIMAVGGSSVGGLIGSLMDAYAEDCVYVTSEIINTDRIPWKGKLFGNVHRGEELFSNCYYWPDMERGPWDNEYGLPVTLEEAKTQAFYKALGWDFENIWDIKEGQSYPFFKLPRTRTQCQRMPMGGFLRI
ncbi:hypothetical protein FQ087_06035 [Sporosarcina sp. ANT_H38]|uniref:hypothetical protein n=1 Tax=Sporosarcina sp. ANT_H38 TaxID=2597358 RepID=UPI0011F1EAEE|nr:hypothetical protein [Sporosarcina sp. ANT_H38]KAA0965824.1 hypothetical protein FQ087_06035 [Sporosarcina sp. ANT_H38]